MSTTVPVPYFLTRIVDNDTAAQLADAGRGALPVLYRPFRDDSVPGKQALSIGEAQALQFLGISVLEPLDEDRRFHEVALPTGWRYETPTLSEPVHYLLDAQGRRRVAIIFDTGVVGDRCYWVILPRFTYVAVNGNAYAITNGGREVPHAGYFPRDEAAIAYLDEKLPEWRSPLSYWVEP